MLQVVVSNALGWFSSVLECLPVASVQFLLIALGAGIIQGLLGSSLCLVIRGTQVVTGRFRSWFSNFLGAGIATDSLASFFGCVYFGVGMVTRRFGSCLVVLGPDIVTLRGR